MKEGQEVQVRVVEVNTEANNLTLSMLDPSSAKAEVARSSDNSEEGGEDNYGGMVKIRCLCAMFSRTCAVLGTAACELCHTHNSHST